jgi:hypothetical protein
MQKIIEVTPVEKNYLVCSVCYSNKNVKEIITGSKVDKNSRASTLRLCEDCIRELKSKL